MTSSRKVGNRFGYSKKDTKENLGYGNKLEKLLNKLIENGWKPYGIEKDDIEVCSYDKDRKKISIGYMNWETPSKGDYDWLFLSLRELVSKESNLRQFVCENNLIKTKGKKIKINTEDFDGHQGFFILYGYEYWIAMSALYNEDTLEYFLLENIKL